MKICRNLEKKMKDIRPSSEWVYTQLFNLNEVDIKNKTLIDIEVEMQV